MFLHANAKLGLAGRLALVRAIEEGMSLKAAAAAFSVSPATAHRWWHRWLEAGGARELPAARSLEPAAPLAAAACARAAGADLRLPPPDRLGAAAGRGRDRLRALDRLEGAQRAGISRPPRPVERAGQPLRVALPRRSAAHGRQPLRALPAARPPRHRRPLAAPRGRSAETTVGYDYAHAIVDDHSRLAYVELHDDEKAATVTGFLERALAFFAEHGIVAKRLMTDNAFSYVKNRSLRELLARHGIRHLTTQPYRPRTNGKVERFHQTMAREWAYGLAYRSHRRPQPRAATLARPLQPATTTQLTRRPAPDQPRSQRPWAGQLDGHNVEAVFHDRTV